MVWGLKNKGTGLQSFRKRHPRQVNLIQKQNYWIGYFRFKSRGLFPENFYRWRGFLWKDGETVTVYFFQL